MEQSKLMAQPKVMAQAVEPVRIPALLWAVAALALFALYLVLQENGALLASGAHWIHEFAHDGRHLLGVPCH